MSSSLIVGTMKELQDLSVIVSAKPKYPELMANNAEDLFINIFKVLKEKEKQLQDLRTSVREVEEEVNYTRDTFNSLKDMFIIEYGTKKYNEIHNDVCLGIVNAEDARNI